MTSPAIERWVTPLLEGYSAHALRWHLSQVQLGIVRRMDRGRVRERGTRHAIRYTLYWLCKRVVGSGQLADLWRDHLDDAVVAVVDPQVTDATTDRELVRMTMEALIEQVF